MWIEGIDNICQMGGIGLWMRIHFNSNVQENHIAIMGINDSYFLGDYVS